MAARRLILVLILLLVISSITAQLAQPPKTEDGTTTTTDSTTTTAGSEQGGGKLLRRRIGPSASSSGPTEVRAAVGDQLQLQVSSAQPGMVTIPARGLIEPVEPVAPARFDLLLREPGRLEVRGPEGRTVAVIVTGPSRQPEQPRPR